MPDTAANIAENQIQFPKSTRLMLVMAFLSFITLGLHEGSLGVAWPSMRNDFGVPLDYLGMILIASTVGAIVSSFNSGLLLARFEFGVLLVVMNLLRAAGLLGYTIAPEWWLVVGSAFLIGLCAGTLDSGMNTFVAARYGAGPLNWLHAFFGLGAMIAPLIMTALFRSGYNWRWGFVVIAILQVLLAIYFAVSLRNWPSRLLLSNSQNGYTERATNLATLGLLVVWLGIVTFFISVGVEIGISQWSFTLLTESRNLPVNQAGLWVSLFWASLTFGRILFGFITDRIGPTRLIRIGMAGTCLGVFLLMWNPFYYSGLAGLVLAGFSIAPFFPVMIGLSPARFGFHHATNAIGFQVAFAYAGGSLIPAFAGIVADARGLEFIGMILFVFSMIAFGLHEILVKKCGV